MIREIVLSFIREKSKWCFFAIDNVCNNRCEMCSIWKETPRIVSLEEGRMVIDKLHENGFNVLQLTGGEPMLNVNFFEMVKYAKSLGFVVLAPTNGTLIDQKTAEELRKSKIDQVSVSLHHCDSDVFEKISGRKGILDMVVKSIEILKKEKVPTSILCTISKDNINDLEKIVDFIDGFDVAVSFCLPVSVKDTSFKLGGENDSVDLSKEEIRAALLRIMRLKKKGYPIANTLEYMKDMIRYLEGKNYYTCSGGRNMLYVDWNLNVFPCMCKGSPVNIADYDFKRSDGKCNECMIQCFREPSVLFFGGGRSRALRMGLLEVPFMANLGLKRIKTLVK
jgi:MoaA/NifB/PqqE/SkfB family radical SAM enzyme